MRKLLSSFSFSIALIVMSVLIMRLLGISPPNPSAVIIGIALLGVAFGIWREQ